MQKQVFTTSSPLMRKNRVTNYSLGEWLPQSIEALGNAVSGTVHAVNTTETTTTVHADVNENKSVSFTEIRSLGIAIAAAAIIITLIVVVFRHK